MKRFGTAIVAVFLSAASVLGLSGDGFELNWNSVDGGGGISSGATFVLVGAIGQHDAGQMCGNGFVLTGGFWAGTNRSGDCDCNGDVDLIDYACFLDCVTGPGGVVSAECETFDLDDDVDVDFVDFGLLQVLFTG